ncbi:alpha/beta-hydrolase [Ophiobolus disseminans]|uniref:Alpha/beta-hydrolase n=1 Tax=Ophiobolus disseminans TaxID=1469910 RepID=A0A6A7A8A1_9PLEO|nr:alpha/beta-hydrolase [Ophiobolus disseminans]
MLLPSSNPWITQPTHSALVPLPTHSLWASTSGPLRPASAPLLIFFTGAGGPSASLIKLQQALSTFIRVLFYDRAGYDRSTLPPYDAANGGANGKDIYAQDTARDLATLLDLTGLKPPYILAAHSYGGIPARAFLALQPSSVAGLCLLDTATELMLALFSRVPPLELDAVARNVDFEALTHLREECGMSDEEWEYAAQAVPRCAEALKREDTHASAYRLAGELQTERVVMGDRPLSVVHLNMARDCRMMFDAGVALGDGTEEERSVAGEFIERFGLFQDMIARAQCGLSRDARYVYYEQWGHDLPIRRPEVAAVEVKRVVERVEENRLLSKAEYRRGI